MSTQTTLDPGAGGGSLADLLHWGGAPAALGAPVEAALGPDAARVLAADPWRILDVRAVRPDQADAFARRLDAGVRADDPRRLTALVAWHLRRAAADGHTALSATVLQATLSGHRVPDPMSAVHAACADGRIVEVTAADDNVAEEQTAPAGPPAVGTTLAPARTMLALADLAFAEDALAGGLLRLADGATPADVQVPHGLPPSHTDVIHEVATHGVLLVEATGRRGVRMLVDALAAAWEASGRRVARAAPEGLAAKTGVLAAADVAVVEGAERLDVRAAASLVEALPDGARLVLCGDTAQLPPSGPGAVLADALASRALPAVPLAAQLEDGPGGRISELVAALREGHLPTVDDPTHSVVVAPATDEVVVALTVRLVSESIPRAHDIPPEDVLVLAPRRRGAAGSEALAAALESRLGGREGQWARTVHEARVAPARAVVLVLPAEAAGSLSRALVVTGCALAEHHLTVVAAAGTALREAVERIPSRPRTTRLAGLLRAGT